MDNNVRELAKSVIESDRKCQSLKSKLDAAQSDYFDQLRKIREIMDKGRMPTLTLRLGKKCFSFNADCPAGEIVRVEETVIL